MGKITKILMAISLAVSFSYLPGRGNNACYAGEIKEGIGILQEYAGIGIIIGFRQDQFAPAEILRDDANRFVNRLPIEVKHVFGGSPAEKAGIRVKDRILAINGISAKEIGAKEIAGIGQPEIKMAEKLTRVRNEIFGLSGTSVVLRIKRAGCVDEESGNNNSSGLSLGLLSIDFTVKREKIWINVDKTDNNEQIRRKN